jgi:hypothetical protein
MPVGYLLTILPATRPENDSLSIGAPLHRDNAFITPSNCDHESVDSSEDGSSDDDEDNDDDDDGDDNPFVGGGEVESHADVARNRLLPPFPMDLPVEDFVFNEAHANISSAKSSSPRSSAPFRRLGLSLSSPIRPERHGKLPTVTKLRERLARRTLQRTVPSSSSGSAPRVTVQHEGNKMESCRKVDGGASGSSFSKSKASRSHQTSSAYTPYDRQSTDGSYTPQPIELDMLELSFKYDHLEPIKTRNPNDIIVASKSPAADLEPEHPRRPIDQTVYHGSIRGHMLDPSLNTGYTATRKRPASMPPPHLTRPSQRQAFMTIGNSAGPTRTLPDSAPVVSSNSTKVTPTNDPPAKTFLEISTTAKISPDAVHPCCRHGRPCRDFDGQVPVPRNPQVSLYQDTLTADHQIRIEEAEYILSQANCF